MSARRTCFVVMGFGKKTDFESGRTLDLDKTYRNIIKPVVDECGLACVRADEIRHSGVIDVPMYTQLLAADLVIADLSTSNPNAMYELGVRHALKPFTTIVIAEAQLKYPFDISHTAIRRYRHLGEEIGYDEVIAFRDQLRQAIAEILAHPAKDSPVYTFLPELVPPRLADPPAAAAPALPAAAAGPRAAGSAPAVGVLMERASTAIDAGDFAAARALLSAVWGMRPTDQPWTGNDDYLVQRLALATYKAQQPTPAAALEEAQSWLARLHPETSNDTETLGLWGAVRKRHWDLTRDPAHLDAAIRAYERGFHLRNDHYNGINFAFLLNVRASVSPPADAIADFVQAARVRREVIALCRGLLEPAGAAAPGGAEARYWLLATLAEASLGTGDGAAAREYLRAADALDVPRWMKDSTADQLAGLGQLLAASPLHHIKT
jgi:hypothetical protein